VLGSRLLDIKGFSGFKLEFDDETKKIIKGSASIIVLVFVNQLYLFSKNYFASFFGDGSLSALSYASSISSVISGLIFFSVFNALISELSSGFAKDIRLKIKKIFTNTFLNLIFLIVPIIVVLVVFRTEILSLVYLRGNFDIEGIRKTETPFVWETLSMFTHILFTIPAALYLAKKKYLLLTKIGVFVYIFGILSNYIFSLLVGYWGISASNFVVTGLHGVLLIVYSRKFIGKCGEYGYRIFLLIISGFISYVLLFFWRMFMKQLFAIDSTVENVILVLASAIVLLLSYFAVTSLFKINYASKIMSAFLR
jgi:putative peptidoglycan lipid II flippase